LADTTCTNGFGYCTLGRAEPATERFMPITKADVLAVLNDPILDKIDFSVGTLRVNAAAFRIVARYIEAGDIGVVPGKSSRVAIYDRRQNHIETPARNPPLDFTDRAQLLHECVHAISDIGGGGSVLEDEVAGYMAQTLFAQLSHPSPAILATEARIKAASPMGRMIFAMQETMRTYNLDNARGFGAKIGGIDIHRLGEAIRAIPDYAGLTETTRVASPGVPVVNGDQMQALREALMRGRQPDRKPAKPIARPMIF
jgi:hypothetical protein